MVDINNLTQTQKRIFIIGIIIAVGIIAFYVYSKDNNYEEISTEEIMVKNETQTEETTDTEKIVVHIMGAVKNEGIVELNEGARVSDAINSAGGLAEDADMSKINLAYVLEDGVKIRIPSINDEHTEEYITTDGVEIVESSSQTTQNGGNSKSGLININTANETELDSLPGIGPSIAAKIINYREENGDFASIEDIKNVNGIGESKFENMKEKICVK